ncbi:hypothetical protein CLOP_g9463 [Closterium sp. NIES-67]|nr:hypothetical protein CLOP_g9463 [Closterium sp. NIES-67]
MPQHPLPPHASPQHGFAQDIAVATQEAARWVNGNEPLAAQPRTPASAATTKSPPGTFKQPQPRAPKAEALCGSGMVVTVRWTSEQLQGDNLQHTMAQLRTLYAGSSSSSQVGPAAAAAAPAAAAGILPGVQLNVSSAVGTACIGASGGNTAALLPAFRIPADAALAPTMVDRAGSLSSPLQSAVALTSMSSRLSGETNLRYPDPLRGFGGDFSETGAWPELLAGQLPVWKPANVATARVKVDGFPGFFPRPAAPWDGLRCLVCGAELSEQNTTGARGLPEHVGPQGSGGRRSDCECTGATSAFRCSFRGITGA